MSAYRADAKGLTEAHIRKILDGVEQTLREPTCTVDMRVDTGVHETPNFDTGVMEFSPNKGRTITIVLKIHGGAVDTADDPVAAARHLSRL